MSDGLLIAGMSDLHGKLCHTAPECDVLCLPGDLVPLYSSAEDWHQWQELEWMERKFVRWLKRQRFRVCLISWGNHDIVAFSPDTRPLLYEALLAVPGVIILDERNPSIVFEGVRFSGYPYTPTVQQRKWAFSQPRGDMRVGLGLDNCFHPETDVLLSHGPPAGFLDRGYGSNDNHGCAELAQRIVEHAPYLVMCGHIHEHRGERIHMWNKKGRRTKVINVSICNRNYSEKGAKVQTFQLPFGGITEDDYDH